VYYFTKRNVRNNKEYGYMYSNKMIDYIINNPDKQEEFIGIISNHIRRIIDTCVPKHSMSNSDIVDYISELSNYACIFVNNKKYIEIYDSICETMKNISKMYPSPEMAWECMPKAPNIED
jgi:hypothetical protein